MAPFAALLSGDDWLVLQASRSIDVGVGLASQDSYVKAASHWLLHRTLAKAFGTSCLTG